MFVMLLALWQEKPTAAAAAVVVVNVLYIYLEI